MKRAIVTDIEGTTSSIRFVKDVLFPYACRHMLSFLETHWQQPDVQAQVEDVRRASERPLTSPQQANDVLQQWIKEDRKVTALKKLQGMIWEEGYRTGEYQAHIYADAALQLAQWHKQGIPLYVYSSGSVKAQKLFFGYSVAGDLNPLFSDYFDTTTGAKQAADAYRQIAKVIGIPTENILFLSDIEQELDAAREAGMKTTLVARPADSDIDIAHYQGQHPIVSSFSGIDPEQV